MAGLIRDLESRHRKNISRMDAPADEGGISISDTLCLPPLVVGKGQFTTDSSMYAIDPDEEAHIRSGTVHNSLAFEGHQRPGDLLTTHNTRA